MDSETSNQTELSRKRILLEEIRQQRISDADLSVFDNLGLTPLTRELAIGVLKVESTARPRWFRLIEALLAVGDLLLSLLNGGRFRNLTVGQYQIGILTSLTWTRSARSTKNYVRRLICLLSRESSTRVFKIGVRRYLNGSDAPGLRSFAEFYNGQQDERFAISYHEALSEAAGLRLVVALDSARGSRVSSRESPERRELAVTVDCAVRDRFARICTYVSNSESLTAVVVLCSRRDRRVIYSTVVGCRTEPLPVLESGRLVGSLLKVPLFAAYLQCVPGALSRCYEDKPITIRSHGLQVAPRNADGTFRGQVTLEYAFANSINTIALQIIEELGVERFIRYLRRCGIYRPLPNTPLLALGTVRLTAWEVLGLFSPIIGDGHLSWIGDAKSGIYVPLNNGERLLTNGTVDAMRYLLECAGRYGTAKYLGSRRADSAGGKTGTSDGARDLWFVGGVDDDIYGMVWIGDSNEQPLVAIDDYLVSASRFAVPLWSDVVDAVLTRRS